MGKDRPASNRRKAERRGHVAEYWAALYLLLKGYRIVAIRYRTRLGEVDLIAKKRGIVVFVEVKARASGQSAVDAVTYASQKRIRAAADLWLSKQTLAHGLSQRFDIVAIRPWRLPVHLADAF